MMIVGPYFKVYAAFANMFYWKIMPFVDIHHIFIVGD